MLPDLSARLAAIEPLRRRAGLFGQIGPVLWLWFSRVGVATLVAGVSSALAVWLGAERLPMGVMVPLVALLSIGPMITGLVLALRGTMQTIGGRDGASTEYQHRLVSEVIAPLVGRATPHAALDASGSFDLADLVHTGLYADTAGCEHRAYLSVSGKEGGVAWRATPVRVWRSVDASSPTSQTRSRTQVIHDGLFVRAAFATGVGRQLRLADRAAGEAIRARSRPVRAAMGTLPESPASGDAAFDAHLVSLTDEPADIAALSVDARRALVAVVERFGGPVRVAVNADGIGLAFPNRGTFRGLSASEEMDTPLRRQSAEESVRDMTTRFAADAELLATIPEAVTRLHQALAVRDAAR